MCIHVADFIRVDASVLKRHFHGTGRPINIGSSHVISVSAHAKTRKLGVNSGPAGFGVFILFQHQNAAAFAKYKTVPVFIPGTRSGLWVVIAR